MLRSVLQTLAPFLVWNAASLFFPTVTRSPPTILGSPIGPQAHSKRWSPRTWPRKSSGHEQMRHSKVSIVPIRVFFFHRKSAHWESFHGPKMHFRNTNPSYPCPLKELSSTYERERTLKVSRKCNESHWNTFWRETLHHHWNSLNWRAPFIGSLHWISLIRRKYITSRTSSNVQCINEAIDHSCIHTNMQSFMKLWLTSFPSFPPFPPFPLKSSWAWKATMHLSRSLKKKSWALCVKRTRKYPCTTFEVLQIVIKHVKGVSNSHYSSREPSFAPFRDISLAPKKTSLLLLWGIHWQFYCRTKCCLVESENEWSRTKEWTVDVSTKWVSLNRGLFGSISRFDASRPVTPLA